MQTKLAAARNTAASLEKTKIPGSAIKGGPANRAVAAANAGAAQAAQIAQLKEDLYSDLTGLIVRGVTDREADYFYDCIQTGVNGSECPILYPLQINTVLTIFQRCISSWPSPRCLVQSMKRQYLSTCLCWTPTAIETLLIFYRTS